jgi:hypothetical protein
MDVHSLPAYETANSDGTLETTDSGEADAISIPDFRFEHIDAAYMS